MLHSVSNIANALGATAAGDLTIELSGPQQPDMAGAEHLALAMSPEYAKKLPEGGAKVALLWEGADWQKMGLSAAIFAPMPRFAMSGVNKIFEKKPHAPLGIHPTAFVSDDAVIGENASIGAFVFIETGAVIGKNARVLSHVSIGKDARIGDDCLLFSGARIGERVEIGDRFIAQPNSAVGNDGFSFVSPDRGAVEAARDGVHPDGSTLNAYARINSLGSVTIGDDVELGANSTIDRGTIVNTRVGDGTKIDNLVQIGHNVTVGKHCLLCSLAGVGGSSKIGDGVVLGGQVGVADNVTVGANVVAAGKSGISSNVPPNRFIMGNPAIKMEANVESYKAYRRLPKLIAKVENLQKQVSKLMSND